MRNVTVLFTTILNDCITFFGTLGKGMGRLFREFIIGADSFGQLSKGNKLVLFEQGNYNIFLQR